MKCFFPVYNQYITTMYITTMYIKQYLVQGIYMQLPMWITKELKISPLNSCRDLETTQAGGIFQQKIKKYTAIFLLQYNFNSFKLKNGVVLYMLYHKDGVCFCVVIAMAKNLLQPLLMATRPECQQAAHVCYMNKCFFDVLGMLSHFDCSIAGVNIMNYQKQKTRTFQARLYELSQVFRLLLHGQSLYSVTLDTQ